VLEANEVASKALATRDEVMGIVAHDLRTPLGAITMKAALLGRVTDLAKVKQQAESIGKIAMRMEYLIRTLLDVTTLEAGKFSVKLAPCPVQELLRETEVLFEPLATSKQIQLELRESESGLLVLTERERALQVLSNLIGNALKFTPERGHVSMCAEGEGTMVRFTVSDSGPGIHRDSLARVFDRFWKKDTGGKKGTGLGLFIAKGIVEAHGGKIGVDSDLSQGAKFYFTLPRELPPEPERGRAADSAPASPA
jgi:signal transduction histidine kinase